MTVIFQVHPWCKVLLFSPYFFQQRHCTTHILYKTSMASLKKSKPETTGFELQGLNTSSNLAVGQTHFFLANQQFRGFWNIFSFWPIFRGSLGTQVFGKNHRFCPPPHFPWPSGPASKVLQRPTEAKTRSPCCPLRVEIWWFTRFTAF